MLFLIVMHYLVCFRSALLVFADEKSATQAIKDTSSKSIGDRKLRATRDGEQSSETVDKSDKKTPAPKGKNSV